MVRIFLESHSRPASHDHRSTVVSISTLSADHLNTRNVQHKFLPTSSFWERLAFCVSSPCESIPACGYVLGPDISDALCCQRHLSPRRIFIDLIRRHAFTSRIWVEFTWISIFWIMELCTSSLPPLSPCGIPEAPNLRFISLDILSNHIRLL